MQTKPARKIVASIAVVILLAMQIFGLSGLLIPYSTEEVNIRFNTLIFPLNFNLVFTFLLDFLVMLYLLYSFDFIGSKKTEFSRQYMEVADVGVILICLIHAVDVYIWHYGLFGVNVILRALIMLILLRVSMAYFGSRRKFFLPQLPFDVYLGYMNYLLVTALGTALEASSKEGGLFTSNARAVLLILALTISAMIIGLKFLNIFSLFTVLLCEGAVAAIHLGPPPAYDGRFPEIYIACILSMAALVAAIIVAAIKRRRS